ncbi:hypothetical protein NCCP602_34880 [Brevibacterium metallidurans]|uniref:Uncharacterized protein n=1 Tax=Brevibacterium metallidurans TaxID=1482676 RepID=A0ABN0SSX7_9MICO
MARVACEVNQRAKELFDEMVRDAVAKQQERDCAEEQAGNGSDRHTSTNYAKQLWHDVKRALNTRPRKKRS